MESKIQIDIDTHRQEHINIRLSGSDDVRDKLLAMFLQTACPNGTAQFRVVDGFCRISISGHNSGVIEAEIVPVHPMEMPKYVDLIQENADKFKTVNTLGD